MANLYVWSAAAGSGSGADWTNAKTTLTAAFTTEVAGDTLFVAHDHAESTAAAIALTSGGTVSNPTKVICVDRAGSVPPVSADRRTTATVTTTGTSNPNITLSGCTHYDGIIFSAGTGSSGAANLIIGNASSQWFRLDNCSLRLPITGASGGNVYIGGSGGTLNSNYVELNNTTMSFAGASGSASAIQIAADCLWRDTPSAILSFAITSGLVSVTAVAAHGLSFKCIGVDFSAIGSGKTLIGSSVGQAPVFRFVDCKLDASVTKAAAITVPGVSIDFVRSGASGINYAVHSQRLAGTLTEETTIVRTGGASDGTTPIAWKVITTANCNYSMPFECPPIAIWNDIDGSAVTATVEGIWGGGAVPNDDDIWLDVEYLGDNSSPQGSFVNDGKADLLTTAAGQTSSSETWGGSTTKFKLACNFTPQQKGWIYCRIKVGRASSTLYVDPLVTLS